MLGAEGWDDIPISAAVRASTALPMIYAPYRVRDRELVDGGIVSTTNLDIAVEAGAKFIVVVNPLVPYVNDFSKSIPTLFGTRVRRVSDMGFPKIGYQTFKLLAYQRLHEMASHWKERYPGVDIVLVEPDPDDELMFQTNILNFASRVDVARHGFESVTLKLAKDYNEIREVCRRHGIEISATRVRKVVRHFSAEREKTRAWRRILEQTTGALLRQSRRVERVELRRVLLVDHVALDLQGRRQLARLLREVVVEDEEPLDLLDPRVVVVDAVELALDQLDDLRVA